MQKSVISFPHYLWVQLLGLLLFLVWALLNSELLTSESALELTPFAIAYWSIFAAVGYAVSFYKEIKGYLSSISWERIGEILVMLGLILWWLHFGMQELVACLLILYAVVTYIRERKTYTLDTFQNFSIAICVVPLVSMLWAKDLSVAWSHALVPILIGGLSLSLRYMRLPYGAIQRIVLVLFRLCMGLMILQIICYLLLVQFYGEDSLLQMFTLNKNYMNSESPCHKLMLWASHGHPSFWSFYLGIPLLLAYNSLRKGIGRVVWAEVVVYWLLLVLFCFIEQPRYGFGVAGLTLCVVTLDVLRRRFNISLRSLALCILVAIVLGGTLIYHLGLLNDPYRWDVANHAWQTILQHPILGLGTGADSLLHRELYQHEHSHNSFLTAIIESGLIGLLALIGWVCSAVWIGYKKRNVALLAFMLLFIPLMQTESPLYTIVTTRLVAIYLFLITGTALLPNNDSVEVQPQDHPE